MATKLKTGKKIRALCYRIIAAGGLLTMIASGIMGREALMEFEQEPEILTGEIYYLSDFRAYVSSLFDNAIIGYAGVGDDNGYPITTRSAVEYSSQAKRNFVTEAEKAGTDLLYHIQTNNNNQVSNISYPLFSEYNGSLLLPDDVVLCCYWDGLNDSLNFFSQKMSITDFYSGAGKRLSGHYETIQYKPNKDKAENIRLLIALKGRDLYTSPLIRAMSAKAISYRNLLWLFIGSACVTVLFGLLSLCSCKAAHEAFQNYCGFTRKIWLEIKLILLFLIFYVGDYYDLELFFSSPGTRLSLYNRLWLYFPMGCLLYLFYADVHHNKAGIFTNFLPTRLYHFIKEYISAVPWHRKALIICPVTLIGSVTSILAGIAFSCLNYVSIRRTPLLEYHFTALFSWSRTFMEVLFGIMGGLLIFIGLCLLLSYIRLRRFIKDTVALATKLSELQGGIPDDPLILPRRSLLTRAAADLNQLESGIENAVEQKNRSNRMRVELITNVSHDLKTPLTSIINYADLLCEESLPQPAADYAQALQNKAYRLKNMVQDVFELSKATSGNLPVEKHLLDLVKLIRQTLADMDERLQESNLLFKLNISEEPIMIEADGEKLYRVFQNLFVNALQYSLDHSRVHIQLSTDNGYALAEVKNTSRNELDFDTTEILERFVRADASRTTDGSGLGLSIVQSFTEACGGTFSIRTDADMFIASVKFPLAQVPASGETAVQPPADDAGTGLSSEPPQGTSAD